MRASPRTGLRRPTADDIERAARTLAAIARVESLQEGVVEFEAEGLAGGRWCEPSERGDSLLVVWVPVPPLQPERELLESCRTQVQLGLEARQRRLEELAFEYADRDQRAGVLLGLQLMYD